MSGIRQEAEDDTAFHDIVQYGVLVRVDIGNKAVSLEIRL